jgi:6-phosphogluconolactonase/glucosamine-6-phosphate isomerase/deaminase
MIKKKQKREKKDDGYSVQLEHYLFDEYYLPPEKEERKEEKLEEQKEQKIKQQKKQKIENHFGIDGMGKF